MKKCEFLLLIESAQNLYKLKLEFCPFFRISAILV